LRVRIADAKIRLGRVDFEWYPYDTISNVQRIIDLLADNEDAVFEAALRDGVLDIGCQDGELAFLFESLGFQVTAIDNEPTNHNGLRGLRALSGQLGSSVQLHQIDLDLPFSFPQKRYGLTILLGVLYHLKNPFQVMELLARHSTYCVCSTRLMRQLPDGSTIPAHSPIAYLLEAYELNDDSSNYWILSESALRRIISRTGWGVSAFFTLGDCESSDPVSIEHDERAFCLLRSRYGMGHLKLIDGWHDPEQSGWRWTKREFSIGLPAGYRQRIT
jgi:tRNA (mo5U34)-methyltransferase